MAQEQARLLRESHFVSVVRRHSKWVLTLGVICRRLFAKNGMSAFLIESGDMLNVNVLCRIPRGRRLSQRRSNHQNRKGDKRIRWWSTYIHLPIHLTRANIILAHLPSRPTLSPLNPTPTQTSTKSSHPSKTTGKTPTSAPVYGTPGLESGSRS